MSVGAGLEKSICHDDFEEFTRLAFSSLLRADQKRWAQVYLHGLLSVEGKKAIRKMVGSHPVDFQISAIQSLQQFISQSPWDWEPVRESLARIIHAQATPRAWIISAVTMPKRGVHSVGATRRFVAPEGRMMNCQLGFGAFLATEHGALPVDWCLELGNEWINEKARRERTRVPEDVDLKTSSGHVLEMTDRLSGGWRLPVAPLVSNVCETRNDAMNLIRGLTERKFDFLLEVPASLVALADSRLMAIRSGESAERIDGSRAGTGADGAGWGPRVGAVRVGGQRRGFPLHSSHIRLPGACVRGSSNVPAFRLFTGLMPDEGGPARFWVTNVRDRRIHDLLDLVLPYGRIAGDLRDVQDSFGLRDFEGRSYPGWHHHMTLVSAAFGYHRLTSGKDRLAII